MLLANKFEVPDKCPEDCRFKGDFQAFDQGSICFRCPVLCCVPSKMAVDKDGRGPVSDDQADHYIDFCLTEPETYRPDWASDWVKFFAGEVEFPELKLIPPQDQKWIKT